MENDSSSGVYIFNNVGTINNLVITLNLGFFLANI